MLELIGTALVDMLDFSTIIGMIAGLAVGLSFGAMPGLNATIGITLLLPVTFGMNPAAALLMLIGVYCGATFAGSISAILIKTPGTAAASATVLEGYPMTLKGKASTALSIALRGSVIGGLFWSTPSALIRSRAYIALRLAQTFWSAVSTSSLLSLVCLLSANSLVRRKRRFFVSASRLRSRCRRPTAGWTCSSLSG